jgi:hypothetical protein
MESHLCKPKKETGQTQKGLSTRDTVNSFGSCFLLPQLHIFNLTSNDFLYSRKSFSASSSICENTYRSGGKPAELHHIMFSGSIFPHWRRKAAQRSNNFSSSYEVPFFMNAAYYANWRIYRKQPPSSLRLGFISHIFYAFAWVKEDGTVYVNPQPGLDISSSDLYCFSLLSTLYCLTPLTSCLCS